MADLQLNSIVLRNWAKFESAHVQFPEYGLVVVSGVNTASNGKLMSVGSGKTAFGEAIGRTVFGIQTRFGHLKDASRDQKGDTYVRVGATFRGKPLTIEAGYKCPEMSESGEALRFVYDGQTIERGKIQQTRAELDALLGMSAPLAAWTVFVDGQHMNFQHLEQNDAVALVMTALKQPPWEQYHENAKKTVLQCKRTLATEQGKHIAAQEAVRSAQEYVYGATSAVEKAERAYQTALSELKTKQELKLNSILAHQRALEEAEARKRAIVGEVKLVEDRKAKRHHELEIALNAAKDKHQNASSKRKQFVDAREAASNANTLAKQAYDTLASQPAVCPTCNRPMEQQADPKDVEAARKTYETTRAQLAKAQQAYQQHEASINALVEAENAAAKALRDHGVLDAVASLNEENRRLDTTIRQSTSTIHQLQLEMERMTVSDADVKSARTVLEERLRAQTDAEAKLEKAAADLSEAKQTLDIVAYWCTAFSPTGIPNMVLQESIAPLNHEARRISSMMTGGTLYVSFSTKRILSGGESRPKLHVAVNNVLGSSDARFSSKGEGGLTNFILAETLGAVGQVSDRIAFRYYDEIVPHQDAVVCQSLYSYLRDLAQAQRILIFIVDHNPAVNNYADYFLQVEKSGDGDECVSTVRWL